MSLRTCICKNLVLRAESLIGTVAIRRRTPRCPASGPEKTSTLAKRGDFLIRGSPFHGYTSRLGLFRLGGAPSSAQRDHIPAGDHCALAHQSRTRRSGILPIPKAGRRARKLVPKHSDTERVIVFAARQRKSTSQRERGGAGRATHSEHRIAVGVPAVSRGATASLERGR
jgi:hypothetical protein